MPESDPISKPESDDAALTALRRSFPVPRRKVEEEPEYDSISIDWRAWAMRASLFAAGAVTGIAGWVSFHREGKPAAALSVAAVPAQPTPPARTSPPDAARDLYVAAASPAPPSPDLPPGSATTAPSAEPPRPTDVAVSSDPAPAPAADPAPDPGTVVAQTPPSEAGPGFPEGIRGTPDASAIPTEATPAESTLTPPSPEPVLGELERKYLTALERASSSVSTADATAWAAEIQRVKSGTALPPPDSTQPAELQRLQSIYRREYVKHAPKADVSDAGARDVDLYFMADDSVALLLNGVPVTTKFLSGSAEAAASVQKATVTLKPKDVLGFRCLNREGARYFCLVARAGVRQLFTSNERWEAASRPDEAWWKGQGPSAATPKVLRGRVDYRLTDTARFESIANVHSVDYDVLWAGSEDSACFRYVIRPVDLPDKPAPR